VRTGKGPSARPGGTFASQRDRRGASRVKERGVIAFLFQDDDFMAAGRRGRRWALGLARAIAATEMRGRVSFKMSCRSDEVDEETMRELRDIGGLSHVYLGVESGDEEALVHLNKRLHAEDHFHAGEVFRRLDLSFDFGFMLLEPYSRIHNVRANVEFLDRSSGTDGRWQRSAARCRMRGRR
jgi:radical SAM superfamily enzyme YgiQ (UPF0313 family)